MAGAESGPRSAATPDTHTRYPRVHVVARACRCRVERRWFRPIIDPLGWFGRMLAKGTPCARAYIERLKSIKNETWFTPSGWRRNQ